MNYGIIFGTCIGLFTFFAGMGIMSSSVTSFTNSKMKSAISLLTLHPLIGVLAGALAAALTQSSSGVTVLVVSLVNSKMMNLYQATSIIMGANIGTTITGQLISLNFFALIPYIMFWGVMLFYLNFNPSATRLGKFLIGFSLLFLGMKIMTLSLEPLKNMASFESLILSIDHSNLKGVGIGAAITAIIQSSSTGIAILQGLGYQGLIGINQAFPIILGQNIGTCVTTLLSSLAVDKNGKRAAVIHLMFNLIGVACMMPFMDLFTSFISSLSPNNVVKQIANAHSLFNIISVFMLLPFLTKLVSISKKIIR